MGFRGKVVEQEQARQLRAQTQGQGGPSPRAQLTSILVSQFHSPYRVVPDPSIRRSKHPLRCASVLYGSASTHRAVMGLVHALLSSDLVLPG
jgi:hypothetical protein